MHFAWELYLDTQYLYLVYALRSNCNKDAYTHEQTTKEFGKMNICITIFGIRIGDRKYLNEYTPFGSVSLWHGNYYVHILTWVDEQRVKFRQIRSCEGSYQSTELKLLIFTLNLNTPCIAMKNKLNTCLKFVSKLTEYPMHNFNDYNCFNVFFSDIRDIQAISHLSMLSNTHKKNNRKIMIMTWILPWYDRYCLDMRLWWSLFVKYLYTWSLCIFFFKCLKNCSNLYKHTSWVVEQYSSGQISLRAVRAC